MSYRGVDVEEYLAMMKAEEGEASADNRQLSLSQDDDTILLAQPREIDNGIMLMQDPDISAEDEEEVAMARAQERMKRMDAQTRFLCRLLDDLYRTGIRRETDRPSKERCHRVSVIFVSVL